MAASTTHPACLDDEDLLRACDVRRGRASGPGGQHRNKVETAVFIVHRATGVDGWASERRSQQENKKKAVFRLRVNLALKVRRGVPGGEALVDYQPTQMWLERTRGGKIACNPKHRDFPAMLAEALDVIAAAKWEVKPAAAVLGVSLSQLLKLLRVEPAALGMVNDRRRELGLGRYG